MLLDSAEVFKKIAIARLFTSACTAQSYEANILKVAVSGGLGAVTLHLFLRICICIVSLVVLGFTYFARQYNMVMRMGFQGFELLC